MILLYSIPLLFAELYQILHYILKRTPLLPVTFHHSNTQLAKRSIRMQQSIFFLLFLTALVPGSLAKLTFKVWSEPNFKGKSQEVGFERNDAGVALDFPAASYTVSGDPEMMKECRVQILGKEQLCGASVAKDFYEGKPLADTKEIPEKKRFNAINIGCPEYNTCAEDGK